MRTWGTILAAALVTVVGPSAAAEPTMRAEPLPELRICVDPENPPVSLNRMGEPPGFDVEIAQAIAARLELRPRFVWVDSTYGGRVLRRSLFAGKCDLFMGLPVDSTAETPEALALTAPYYSSGYLLIGWQERSDAAVTPAEHRRARIAVERQSGAHMRLERIDARLVVYGSQREVVDAVARRAVELGAVWLPDVDRLLQDRAPAVRVVGSGTPERLLRWNVAMGVRRSDTNLQSAVSRAVGDLLREGRIAAIFEKYRVPFYPPLIDRRG
jgi:polar amino acid transport system substrate-binding protein